MKFLDLTQHIESCIGTAGATRRAWNGRAYVVRTSYGNMALMVDGFYFQYAFSFEDVTADDWEPV